MRNGDAELLTESLSVIRQAASLMLEALTGEIVDFGIGVESFQESSNTAIFWGPHLAASLHLPNDMIVEDRSVDLSQSILQDELLSHPSEKYLHVRVYRDCTDVIHATMYNHGKIRDILVDCMSRV